LDTHTVGVIGLGSMGGAMSLRLAEKYKVIGCDNQSAARERLAAEGVAVTDNAAQVAANADLILLSLPSSEASVQVVEELCAAGLSCAQLIVENSTSGVAAIESSHQQAVRAGYRYVDAPVSGGRSRARLGTLSVMAAGAPADIEAARPVLDQLGRLFVVGEQPGAGQSIKLANNIIAATTLAVTSEAVAVAVRSGLSMEMALSVINASTGRSDVSETKFPQFIVPGTFDFGGLGKTTLKDVNLYLQAAEAYGMPHFVGARSVEVWREFVGKHPDADMTRIYEYLNSASEREGSS
jgi:3-hydroxyisobutyrate dehydrogenase